MEGGSRGDGVPPVTLSAERNVAESPASPLRDKRIPAHRNIPRTATCHQAPHCGLDGETPLDRLARNSERVRYAGPDIDLEWIFSYRFVRRVSRARTVNLHGRQYETVAGLAGQKVTLVVAPEAPPERALTVLHEDGETSLATLVDLQVNARARRSRPPGEDKPPTPARPQAAAPPARPRTPARQQLRLRQLASRPTDPQDQP